MIKEPEKPDTDPTSEEIMLYSFRKIQAHVDPNNAAYMKAWRISEDMILLFGTASSEPELECLFKKKRIEIRAKYTTAIKNIIPEPQLKEKTE